MVAMVAFVILTSSVVATRICKSAKTGADADAILVSSSVVDEETIGLLVSGTQKPTIEEREVVRS